MISERLRRRLELRRSSAASPHGKGRLARYDADWLAEYEAEVDHLEPYELCPGDGEQFCSCEGNPR